MIGLGFRIGHICFKLVFMIQIKTIILLRNIIFLFVFACNGCLSLYAQVVKIPGGTSVLAQGPWVEIYSQPDLQGTVWKYIGSTTRISLPLTGNPIRISVKVQPGYVAYINTCDEFNEEVMIYKQRNITLAANCPLSIRIEKKAQVDLRLAGISNTLHNNDCKRVYGTVLVKAFELTPDGHRINSIISEINLSNAVGQAEWVAFTNASSSSRAFIYDPEYVFNNNPIPVLSKFLLSTEPAYSYHAPKVAFFIVGESAIRENRVRIEVIVNLGTAHKMNDVAKFYPALRMPQPISLVKSLNECGFLPVTNDPRPHEVVFGPYNIRAAPQSAGSTQTEEGHEIRVHIIGYW